MSAELIYKTTSLPALEWWAEVQRDADRVHQRRRAFMDMLTAEIGPSLGYEYRTLHAFFSYDGASWITGIDVGGDERRDPPKGWRYDRGRDILMPAKRTPEGKEIVAILNSLDAPAHLHQAPNYGIPSQVRREKGDHSGSIVYYPGIWGDADEPALYVAWGTGWVREEVEAAQGFPQHEIEWEEISLVQWREIEKRLEKKNAR